MSIGFIESEIIHPRRIWLVLGNVINAKVVSKQKSRYAIKAHFWKNNPVKWYKQIYIRIVKECRDLMDAENGCFEIALEIDFIGNVWGPKAR